MFNSALALRRNSSESGFYEDFLPRGPSAARAIGVCAWRGSGSPARDWGVRRGALENLGGHQLLLTFPLNQSSTAMSVPVAPAPVPLFPLGSPPRAPSGFLRSSSPECLWRKSREAPWQGARGPGSCEPGERKPPCAPRPGHPLPCNLRSSPGLLPTQQVQIPLRRQNHLGRSGRACRLPGLGLAASPETSLPS